LLFVYKYTALGVLSYLFGKQMNRVFASIIVVVIVVGALMVYQATRISVRAVLLPSEILGSKADSDLSRIKVGGRVSSDPITYLLDPSLELSFSIVDPTPTKSDQQKSTTIETTQPISAVKVVYNGLKPDMFAAGRDVIIEGEFKDGTLIAHELLTQCPSKYEPPKPSGQKGGY
jgi:cytochrome c-type biogenesis protein CcmE